MLKIIFITFISLVLVNKIAVEPELKRVTESDIIDYFSNKYRIDPKIVRAIIHVESKNKVGAINKRSKDHGLMQINISNIKRLGLDKKRLTTDYAYSLEQGIKILVWFRDRYESKLGNKWVSRYNCGTKHKCENTRKSKNYIKKVYAAI